MDDPWDLAALDLPSYLAAVGVPAREPSLDALAELQAAHMRTFPFENLDVLLRRHPGVALTTVQDKFVRRGRGGYCFEHVTLFAAVLEKLGYDARRHLGRVGDVTRVARTHAVVFVTLDGARHLVDPGFGMSVTRPVPLVDGTEVDDGGWHYRIGRVDTDSAGATWELHRLREHGWELMHATDELPVMPVDLVMSHHYTSTFPTSPFTNSLNLAKYLPGRHVTVTGSTVTVRRPGEPTEHRPLADGELRERFTELGVTLPPAEVDEVLALLATLAI